MEENIYPINFCIDDSKFKTLLYNKSQAFSFLIPGLQSIKNIINDLVKKST